MAYNAVLVTGAPASGKSTLLKEIASRISPVRTVEFGKLIGAHLKEQGRDLSHAQLRAQSAQVVTPTAVAELDAKVVQDIVEWLAESHVVIASHAVTHEDYGIRVTAFSALNLAKLPLSAIVVLQAPPEVLVARVESQGDGRRSQTFDQAQRLQTLQTTLALTFGVMCGCPVYVVDSGAPSGKLAEIVLEMLQIDGALR